MKEEWITSESMGNYSKIYQRITSGVKTSKNFNRMDREEYLELVKMNTGIEITSVESSNIEGIGYNVKKHHLWVSFKNNKVYRYDKVLKSNSKRLLKSESKR